MHNLKHNEVLHEHVVLLTVEVGNVPLVAQRTELGHLGKGFHRVVLHYGFMEQPNIPRDLAALNDGGIPIEPMGTSYFIGRNSYVGAARSTSVSQCRPSRRPPVRPGHSRQPSVA